MVRNMFKDNNKKPEQLKWRRSNVFVVNFENISHLFLVFVLLTFEKKMLAGLLQFSDTFFYNLLHFLPSTRPLTVFIKNSILEVQLDCEYTSNIRSQNFDSRPNSDHNSRTKNDVGMKLWPKTIHKTRTPTMSKKIDSDVIWHHIWFQRFWALWWSDSSRIQFIFLYI